MIGGWLSLSQHESMPKVLRHCTSWVELGYDRTRYQGCRATGHTRYWPNVKGHSSPKNETMPRSEIILFYRI